MPAPLKILIADDSQVIRNLLNCYFTKRGHQVSLAEDGEAALVALRAQRYDVALVDFHLPKIDGLKVVSSIKSESGDHHRPPRFVALTGDVKGLLAHSENRKTFDLAIAKPIDVVQLCNVIESLQEFVAGQDEVGQTPVVSADALSRDNDRRAHRRATIDRGTATITLTDGSSFGCKVLNLSLGGAAVEVEVRPPLGERVMLGHTEARIVRHTESGLGLEFIQNPCP